MFKLSKTSKTRSKGTTFIISQLSKTSKTRSMQTTFIMS
jgi:hypothetical protein